MSDLFLKYSARDLYRSMRKRYFRWYEVRAADAMVISFPKSGRTWLRYMLALLMERKGGNPVSFDSLLDPGRKPLPKILFTHAGSDRYVKSAVTLRPDQYLEKKLVLLSRDPRDVVVSYYFELTRRTAIYNGSLPKFILDPEFGITQIIEFMNAWIRSEEQRGSFLLVRYEDLHNDTLLCLRNLVYFLSIPQVSDSILQKAIDDASFESMRRLEVAEKYGPRLRPGDPGDVESYKTRKGKVGGFRDYLSRKQIAMMNEMIQEHLDPRFGY